MDCNLIFYSSRKTGYCESALKSALEGKKYKVTRVQSAYNPEMLGEKINESLCECNMIFVVGGMDRDDGLSTPDILSKAFSKNKPLPTSDMLKIGDVTEGYKLSCLKQTIVLLPDSPEKILPLVNLSLKEK